MPWLCVGSGRTRGDSAAAPSSSSATFCFTARFFGDVLRGRLRFALPVFFDADADADAAPPRTGVRATGPGFPLPPFAFFFEAGVATRGLLIDVPSFLGRPRLFFPEVVGVAAPPGTDAPDAAALPLPLPLPAPLAAVMLPALLFAILSALPAASLSCSSRCSSDWYPFFNDFTDVNAACNRVLASSTTAAASTGPLSPSQVFLGVLLRGDASPASTDDTQRERALEGGEVYLLKPN